jgi:hypothetical protein
LKSRNELLAALVRARDGHKKDLAKRSNLAKENYETGNSSFK